MTAEQKWLTPDHAGFYRGGHPSVYWYNDRVMERRKLYPNWESLRDENKALTAVAHRVAHDGYYKIEDFWNTDLLDQLRDQTLQLMEQNHPDKIKHPQEGRHTQVYMPLLNAPVANQLATDPRILAIATAFLNCFPALGTSNLRLSTAEKSESKGTCMFHRDFNSPVKFIKFFTYLNDVTMENGPFTYVEASNREMPVQPHWSTHHRWPDETIESIYGKDRIKNITANYGDLLIATTVGFHKGLQLQKGSRLMLTLNYLVHPELGGQGIYGPPEQPHQVSMETFKSTKHPESGLYDFMTKV